MEDSFQYGMSLKGRAISERGPFQLAEWKAQDPDVPDGD